MGLEFQSRAFFRLGESDQVVPEPHTYFTNGDWTTSSDPASDSTHPLATLEGWDPISDATYDSGVVCVGEGSAAVLWVEEED